MPQPYLVQDCPRCKAKRITFDVLARNENGKDDWIRYYELPSVCRMCRRTTVWLVHLNSFALSDSSLKDQFWTTAFNVAGAFKVDGYVSLKDGNSQAVPDFVPATIGAVFSEAAMAAAVNCPNASVSMSRLCLDLVTKGLLPDVEDDSVEQPNRDARTKLFSRLDWLFAHSKLPVDLKELADVIRNQGNDGAHDGTCQQVDAEDLLDFTTNVLERVYTLPERVRQAKQRSLDRRS